MIVLVSLFCVNIRTDFGINLFLSLFQVKAVVVTYDKHFSFAKLIKACSYAKNRENHFIATNEDASFPIENKEIVIPGKP